MTDRQPERIPVEVAYALPDRQEIIALSVEKGCTAREAARRSGIAGHFPELDLEAAVMGIFSKVLDGKLMPSPDVYQLEPRDRVEIYRPLLIDPKEARKAKAKKQQAGKTDKADNDRKAGSNSRAAD